MTLDYDFSDKLKAKVTTLRKTDKKLTEALFDKVTEVLSRDETTVEFYKNLKSPMQEFKRVHVDSFVLIFKFFKKEKFVFFEDFDHHDKAYQ